jgi:hypothetical protein
VECLRVVRQTSPESCQCLFAPAMAREVSSSPRHVSHSCFRPRDLTSPPVLGMRRAQVFRLTYSKVFELFIAGMTRISVARMIIFTSLTFDKDPTGKTWTAICRTILARRCDRSTETMAEDQKPVAQMDAFSKQARQGAGLRITLATYSTLI